MPSSCSIQTWWWWDLAPIHLFLNFTSIQCFLNFFTFYIPDWAEQTYWQHVQWPVKEGEAKVQQDGWGKEEGIQSGDGQVHASFHHIVLYYNLFNGRFSNRKDHPDFVPPKSAAKFGAAVPSVPTPAKLYATQKTPKMLKDGLTKTAARARCSKEYRELSDEKKLKWIKLALQAEPKYLVNRLFSAFYLFLVANKMFVFRFFRRSLRPSEHNTLVWNHRSKWLFWKRKKCKSKKGKLVCRSTNFLSKMFQFCI